MTTRFFTVLLCNLLLAPIVLSTEIQQRTIVTSGSGEVIVEPDMASIHMQLRSENSDSSIAKSVVDKQFNRLLTALKAVDIDKDDLVAANIRISPKYDYRNQRRQFVGYMAVRNVSIRITELDKLNAVLDKSLDAGVAQVGDIRYSVSNEQLHQNRARQLAIEDSKSTARKLAKAYGAELGEVININYRRTMDTGAPIMPRQLSTFTEGATDAGVYLQDAITFTDKVDVIFQLK